MSVIGAIVVAGFGLRIRLNAQAELLGNFLDGWIESISFRAGDLDFFRIADRREAVVVQV